MNKKFSLTTSDRQARPRSKRLQGLGGASSGSGGSTVVQVSGGSMTDPNSHQHANKIDLDKITTSEDGYINLTQMRQVEETDEEGNTYTNWKSITDKAKAGYADMAAVAHDLTPDSPVRQQFLSRLADDVAEGRITFLAGLQALVACAFEGGMTIGDYTKGFEGASIDSAGNAEFESITARSYLKVFELIYNRINAVEGNTSFADVGTIESISADGTLLTMRKRWDGDFTAFQPGDIIYGYVNDLDGENGGVHIKAWAFVQSVDRTANTLRVVYYNPTATPAGVNYTLRAHMVITRWGNNIEPNAISWANPDYTAVIEKRGDSYVNVRQSSFFISCEDGNLVELMGVNKPILDPENYGTVLGRIPDGMLDSNTEKLINKDQPYLYARGIIVQDLIRVDYRGVVTRTSNYRGTWSAETANSADDYYRSTTGVYDTVTWNNCLWQCIATGTTDEPSDTSGSWVKMSGGTDIPDINVWKIIPNTDIVTLRYDDSGNVTIVPARVSCDVLLTSDSRTKTYSSSLDLYTDYKVKLYYSLNNATWTEFIIGSTEPLETEELEAFEAETSTAENPQYLILGGDDVNAAEIGDRIYFELRNDTDVLARTVIPVVKDGQKGDKGDQGDKGDSVNTVDVEYAISTSNSTAPFGGWETTAPMWEDGRYIWSRTKIEYSDGTITYTEPVCITGGKGPTGVGISSIVEQYFLSSSSTQQINGAWSETRPEWRDGWYIWTRSVITYTDGSYTVTSPICVTGAKGEKGDKGDQGDRGDRGPALRGPQAWEDCDYLYTFYAGGENEPYLDIVEYNGNYYYCKKTHLKLDDRYPNSPADQSNQYWQLGDKVGLVATKILLAQYALVKNLGVETVEMKDSEGNILFQVKDGNVTCNIGTFNGVNVRGNLLSGNEQTWNEIDVNAQAGYLIMRGPDAVQDENRDLPAAGAKKVELLRMAFEVDPDTLSRYANLLMTAQQNRVSLGPLDGIRISNNGFYGKTFRADSAGMEIYEIDNNWNNVGGRVSITNDGISYTDESGANKYKSWNDLLK